MSLTSSLTVRVCESQRFRLENADCTGGGACVNNLSQKEDGQCRQDGLGLASCAWSLSEEVSVEFFWQLFRRCGRQVTTIFLQRRFQVARGSFSIKCSTVFHST